MRNIYTYGGRPAVRNRTVADLLSLRRAIAAERMKGLTGFRKEVKAGTFPREPYQVPMIPGEYEKLCEALYRPPPVHR
ncbi:MAG: hypothetical protein OXH64_02800 [Rhodospirillaceae bacterium]|nr:hypothetical protein [Rhodospirillaceae bacterium]